MKADIKKKTTRRLNIIQGQLRGLAQMVEDEKRQFPNVNCADVNDKEGNGCDNLRTGTTVQPYPFYSGGRVAAGSYIDENKATNVESPYRYDHMKVTLFVDSRQDAAKCIPDENRQGEAGNRRDY